MVNTNPESKQSSPEGIKIYVDDEVPVGEILPIGSRNTLINERVNVRTKGTVIRSHFTSSGLVFVTLSDDSLPFREFFPDLEPLLARVDFTKLKYRRSIAYEGDFNWKTM